MLLSFFVARIFPRELSTLLCGMEQASFLMAGAGNLICFHRFTERRHRMLPTQNLMVRVAELKESSWFCP